MYGIAYKEGYKYQLQSQYSVELPIKPSEAIVTEYIELTRDGTLTIKHGYCWDGPSGPTYDRRCFMRASLVHDALYQLIREGELENHLYRCAADQVLRDICIEDGMNRVSAALVYYAVRWFAGKAALPSGQNPTIYAP